MTNYNGILIIGEEDLIGVSLPISTSYIYASNSDLFADAAGQPYETIRTVLPLDLPADMPSLMLHNWIEGCDVETAFNVDIVSSIEDSEERRLLSRWTGLSAAQSHKALMSLMRLGQARMPVPLYSDFTVVDSGGASAKSISCQGTLRRFFPGARLVIFDLVNDLPVNIEYAVINNAQAAQIVLDANLTNTYAEGAIVLPLMDCEVLLRTSGVVFRTDTVSEMLFRATEVAGPSALLASAVGTPAGFSEYEDYPIFAPTPYLPNTGYKMGFARSGKVATEHRSRWGVQRPGSVLRLRGRSDERRHEPYQDHRQHD